MIYVVLAIPICWILLILWTRIFPRLGLSILGLLKRAQRPNPPGHLPLAGPPPGEGGPLPDVPTTVERRGYQPSKRSKPPLDPPDIATVVHDPSADTSVDLTKRAAKNAKRAGLTTDEVAETMDVLADKLCETPPDEGDDDDTDPDHLPDDDPPRLTGELL